MRTLVSIVLLAAALFSLPIQASPLGDARAAGQIVEIPSGYVKAHGNVPPRINALVASVNERRREAYQRIAKKNGISVNQVASESYTQRQK